MSSLRRQNLLFLGLVIIYAELTALFIYLPSGSYSSLTTSAVMPFSLWVMALIVSGLVLVLYAPLGFLGLWLGRKVGFPTMLDEKVTNKQRFLRPLYGGLIMGLFLIAADYVFAIFNGVGHFPHPSFPSSLVASLAAGIGEEIMFRLFFLTFWYWLLSRVILRRWAIKTEEGKSRKRQNIIFWIVATLAALAFAAGHFPAALVLLGYESIAQIPWVLSAEIIFLNGGLSLVFAYYYRRYGYLAAAGAHFWTDIVWHVLWGAMLGVGWIR